MFDRSHKKNYRCSLLSYKPSLRQEEKLSLAVVAELLLGNEQRIYLALGRQRAEQDLARVSTLGHHILRDVEHWLGSELEDAIQNSDDPLCYLYNNTPLNLSFSDPTALQAAGFMEELVRDFAAEVLGVDEDDLLDVDANDTGASVSHRPAAAGQNMRVFSLVAFPSLVRARGAAKSTS